MRISAVIYGVISYLLFVCTFLYAIGFVGDLMTPTSIDRGATTSMAPALGFDTVLLAIFALQHSLMARPAFKEIWTQFVPVPVERSTYVLLASLTLDLLFWQWRPLPETVWRAAGAPAAILWGLFAMGWALVLTSTFLIDHFDLFGLKQVWDYRRRRQAPPAEFRTPLFYRVVRHPIYLGFLLAFWAAPVMTRGRLFFAIGTTAYVLIAIQLEERDLLALFGSRYRDYRKRVAMLLPWPR